MNLPHDFSDRLSPMLVKELRQGTRSHALLISLFLLQGLLILNAIVGLGMSAGGDLSGTTAIFWTILGLPLLVILPLSALGGIGGEIRANTLDLIFLTRLTAGRIVLGKWIAVVAQSALLTTTVLPYIALRYYLGGVNITADIASAAVLLAASAVLSAFTVAMSAFPSRVVKILIGVGFFFALQMLTGLGAAMMFGGGRGAFRGWLDWPVTAAAILLVPLFILLMLEVAAIRIAPSAENHAGISRLLTLLFVAVAGTAAMLSASAEWLIVLGQSVAAPFCIAALCEPPPQVSGVLRPLVRRGRLGSFLARVFTPGWHTGMLFVLLVWTLVAGFWIGAGWLGSAGNTPTETTKRMLSLAGFGVSLLVPAVLAPAFSRRRLFVFVSFFGACSVLFLLAVAFSAGGGARDAWILGLTVYLPPLAVFAPAFDDLDATGPLVWMAFLAAGSLVGYWIRSRKPWRRFGELREDAKRDVA
jgi:hypothetical protein